ncbi:hypothetical protein CesoFtcFv8_003992 [Champsocephalus esox]|uniref:Cardiomyopathy-associated protein 5 n=1 Tax=Champsocephalus esox TaxID=159716 RepID=A0AAN8CTS6_9TELE|nr:hypothetical protein CesoFtcFv8_003992 [Champsocephalus esox]
MEECESLDSEMTELQEVQSEASEALSQDDEDEEEELRNSLREAVQDQSVKPQLQCLMVDQSFSMVTVQSEDSGIVWETASSRCSTPWASETSSTSEAYSMEGAGAAGKITIVFDEEKVIRRRTRSGGRSRLGDRLSRPGSSRSASVLGVERPEMAGVSLPNVKKEKSETEPDLEEIKNKDQQLFSLISEGYEILNIKVPSKLPTVDEEESTELKDNLSYLDQTPMIRSRNNHDWTQNPALQDEGEVLDPHEHSKQDSPQLSEDTEHRHALTQKKSTVDIDYFEPFTMIDVVVPEEDDPEQQEEEEQPAAKPNVEEQKETATDSLSASEDSFDFVTDVDIVGEHLDEVFYGEGASADALQRSNEDEAEGRTGMRLESQRSVKEKGSVLFGGEDTILTPIFISSGPPKIIDQILLDEPTAMSFMYSDLYEDAVGERTRSDEEHSEAESVSSEKTYRRRYSDSEEDGYLEKFTLKDDIPSVEVQPESEEGQKEGQKEGRVIWSQSRFDMTGCLTRVDIEEEKDKTEEQQTQEVVEDKSEDLQSATFEEKGEIVAVAGKEEEIQLSTVTEEQAVREASEEFIQDIKLGDDQMEDQEVKHEVKEGQIQPTESHTEKPLPETQQVDSKVEKAKESEEHERDLTSETTSIVEAGQPCQTGKGVEETAQVEVNAAEETAAAAPIDSEEPHIIPEKTTDTKMAAASEKVETEAIAEAPAEEKQPETERQEMHTSTEIETSAETSISGKQEAAEGVPEDGVPVEVLADCDSAVHALVEVTDKAVDEKEIHTQVQIELQELTSTETKYIQTAAPEGEDSALTDETAVKSQSPELIIDIADQEPEVKAEISSEVIEPEMPEEVQLTPEANDETHAEVTGSVAQEKVKVDDEFILLVPKGQAVEVDIEFSQTSEKSPCDTEALSEPDGTCEAIFAPEPTAVCQETCQAPDEETTADYRLEVKPEVVDIETLPRNELDATYSPPATAEEHTNESEPTTTCPETLNEETMAELETKVAQPEDVLPRNELDSTYSPPATAEEHTNESEPTTTCPETLNEETMAELETKVAQPEDVIPRNELDTMYSPPATAEEHTNETEPTTTCPETLNEETMAELETKVAQPEDVLPRNELDSTYSPPATAEEHTNETEPTTTYPETLNEETMAELETKVAQPEDVLPRNELDTMYSPPATAEEHTNETEPTTTCPETLNEETMAELETKVAQPEDVLPRNELDSTYSPPATAEEHTNETEPTTTYPETLNEETMAELETKVAQPEDVLPRNELDSTYSPPATTEEHTNESEPTTTCPETLNEETMAELETKVAQPEDVLPRNELDSTYSPPATTEEGNAEEQKMQLDFIEDEGVVSTLRSFTPQEDLSELQPEEIQSDAADVEQKVEMPTVEEAPEASPVNEDFIPEMDLHREDVDQKIEQDVEVAEAQEDIVEELGYEIISIQDVKKMPEPEIHRDAEEPKLESGQEKEQKIEMEAEEIVLDVSPEEEVIEDDYDIIDAEEQSQAQLAAELQGMDWFCPTCGGLLAEDDCSSGEHHDHEVTAVDQAYEEIKEKLSDWISELQGRSENIEDLVSELELAYNSVEDQFVESEAAMQAQNEGMMALVMEQYNNMSVSMEEEKKAKLEQLYDQIVSFQESMDSAKATLETTAREAETGARSPDEIHASLKAALDSAMSLELGPKGLLVFEDYTKGNTSSSNLAQRKGIPVPQRPTLQAQEPGSASSTSVTVYWKVNPGDIIDCFQVYCMEDPQGAVSEEYRVTVKESYCVLEELEPDKTYKVWVMAVNYTGCSLPSERLAFRTAPSVPVIDTERCTVMWDSATLRWSSTNLTPEQSYTLEYCRQYELEGEGLRSISAIRSCEQKVLLQPNENYLFYIKAVNESGASEQSEAALISSKGTRFHLLKASAHPALELSVDQTTVHYSQDAHENTQSTDTQCPSILGELLPAHGHYYWETVVSGSTAYRIGVADSTANRNSPLGENSLSWCLQCIPTPSGCSYQLLHNDVQSSVFVMEMPERVGTLLDYKLGRLSFYNAQSGQVLGSFCQRFPQPCHPALGLEVPGSLEVSMVLEVPEFIKDS